MDIPLFTISINVLLHGKPFGIVIYRVVGVFSCQFFDSKSSLIYEIWRNFIPLKNKQLNWTHMFIIIKRDW